VLVGAWCVRVELVCFVFLGGFGVWVWERIEEVWMGWCDMLSEEVSWSLVLVPAAFSVYDIIEQG
jgi:hypothetical protein